MTTIKAIATLIISSLIISMTWCGEANCIASTGSAQCAAVQAGSPGDRHIPSSDSSEDHADCCSCTCHVPVVDYSLAVLTDPPPAQTLVDVFTSRVISSPNKTVYRPPTAA